MPARLIWSASTLSSLLAPIPRRTTSVQPLVCPSCLLPTLSTRTPIPRQFSNSHRLRKKSSASSKSARKTPDIPVHTPDRTIPANSKAAAKDAEIDPYDYTDLEAGIAKAIERLKAGIVRAKDVGRVGVSAVEGLEVDLPTKNSDAKSKARLGDIASVVPKGGRSLSVFAAEEAHVKPLMAAIRASSYSLTPQAPNAGELQITVPIPPVTAETRSQAAAEVKRYMEKAGTEVKGVRGDAQKRYRRMELEKLVIKDEIRKGHKGMEEVVKKAQEEIKRVGEAGIKALER
jgi:ribosome recycling factor